MRQVCSLPECDNQLYRQNKTGVCRDCRNTVLKMDFQRIYMLSSMYKMTEDDYDNIVLYQNGLCPLCDHPLPEPLTEGTPKLLQPQVDHDHSCCPTNQSCGNCIRGIVHGSCNMALGKYETFKNRDWSKFDHYLMEASRVVH